MLMNLLFLLDMFVPLYLPLPPDLFPPYYPHLIALYMLILSLLVSNLIVVYILIVASCSYVKNWHPWPIPPCSNIGLHLNIMTTKLKTQYCISVSLLAALSQYITRLYTDISTFSTVLVHHKIVYQPHFLQYYISFSTTFPSVIPQYYHKIVLYSWPRVYQSQNFP